MYVSDDSFTYYAPPEIKLDDATEFAKNKQLVDADLDIHGDERWYVRAGYSLLEVFGGLVKRGENSDGKEIRKETRQLR